MTIDAVLLDRYTEHLACTGAVDILPVGEHPLPPILTSQPRDYAGFDGREVGDEKGVAGTRYKSRADQLGKRIRGRIVEHTHRVIIPGADDGTRLFQIGHLVLGQILKLNIPASPASSSSAVELKASAYTPIGADRRFHSLILFDGALRQLLPENKHRPQWFRGGLEQLRDLLFTERFCFQSVIGKPVLHLLHGVRVIQHGELFQLGSQFLARAFVDGNGAAHQSHVHGEAPVVDLLVEVILIPYRIWHRILPQPLLNAHFSFHVAQVVGFEGRPFVGRISGQMPLSVLARNTEILDEVFAFRELLLIQPQCGSSILQG